MRNTSSKILSPFNLFRRYGWAMFMLVYFIFMTLVVGFYPYFSIISACLMLAFSTFALGGLLGFMFGVPGADPNNPSKTDSRERTNLELISDWLTKILLGAGLVELKPIINAAMTFSNQMGQAFGTFPFSDYIGLFIAIGFGSCGVVTGYLWSQLHFKSLIDRHGGEG